MCDQADQNPSLGQIHGIQGENRVSMTSFWVSPLCATGLSQDEARKGQRKTWACVFLGFNCLLHFFLSTHSHLLKLIGAMF